MANCFKQYVVIFSDPAERVTGDTILKELSGFIDTDSADVKVDENSLQIRFVTAEADNHIVQMCEDVKVALDMTNKVRLFYKVTIVSL